MIPKSFPGVTTYLGAPPNWDPERDGECDPLPVRRFGGAFISRWQPDSDELAKLNAGGAVELWIMAPAHPVVSLQAVGREDA